MDWKDEADSGLFWLRRVPVMQEGGENQDFGRRCAGNGRVREEGDGGCVTRVCTLGLAAGFRGCTLCRGHETHVSFLDST